jgi:hypothetical protein
MAKVNRKGPSLRAAVADLWRVVSGDLFDTYHPERHYMRGPGPKWHAKHVRQDVSAPADLSRLAKA